MLRHHSSTFSALPFLFSLIIGPALGQGGQESAGDRLKRAIQQYEDGRTNESRALLLQLLPALRREGAPAPLGEALNELSQASIALGRYGESIQWATEAAALRSALGDMAGEATSLNNLGLSHLYLGNYSQAIRFYQQALEIDKRSGDREGEILRLNNIANVHYYEGAYTEALGLYLRALKLLEQVTGEVWSAREKFRTIANLAVLYQKLGQNDRALALYQELLAEPESLGGSEEARLLGNIGVLYRHLGDPVKALEYYERARAIFARWHHSAGELGVLRNIGILQAMNLGDLESARRTFTRVVQLAEQIGVARTAMQGRLYRAETERRLRDLAAARADFQHSLESSESLGATEEQWKALFGLGRISAAEKRPEEAARSFAGALEVIESLRSRLALSSLRPGFLADKRDVYGALIAALLEAPSVSGLGQDPGWESERAERVFGLMENGRSRTFQDLLGDSIDAVQGRRNPDIVSRLRGLRADLTVLTKEMSDAADELRPAILARYNAAEAEYARVEEELSRLSPLRSPHPVRLKAVQEALSTFEIDLLVEFWVGEDSLAWVWATPERAGTASIPFPDRSPVSICLDAISNPEKAGWRLACAPLSNLVFGHLDRDLLEKARTLAVVPDGILELVPVEALSLPNGAIAGSSLSLQYLPSAAILTARTDTSEPRIRPPWFPSMVAFGNPAPSDSDNTASLERWPSLPFAEVEIEGISELLPGRKSVHLGSTALKALLPRNEDDPAPILHLATHAAIDLENPDRSRIVFSGTPETGPYDYLFLREIPNTDFSGVHLITLSACETSRGKLIIGEGIQDFSRTLLLAGARVTVSTLWKVSDQATAEFMKQFYFHLGDGLTVADSLRQARRSLIESGSSYSHPYYWAPFIATGQASLPVPLPLTWRMVFVSVLALAALTAALLWLALKWR